MVYLLSYKYLSSNRDISLFDLKYNILNNNSNINLLSLPYKYKSNISNISLFDLKYSYSNSSTEISTSLLHYSYENSNLNIDTFNLKYEYFINLDKFEFFDLNYKYKNFYKSHTIFNLSYAYNLPNPNISFLSLKYKYKPMFSDIIKMSLFYKHRLDIIADRFKDHLSSIGVDFYSEIHPFLDVDENNSIDNTILNDKIYLYYQYLFIRLKNHFYKHYSHILDLPKPIGYKQYDFSELNEFVNYDFSNLVNSKVLVKGIKGECIIKFLLNTMSDEKTYKKVFIVQKSDGKHISVLEDMIDVYL